jgi:copper(I)-binding protein
MKTSKSSRCVRTILTLLSGILLAGGAHAATITAAKCDLILGFRATETPGQTVNLEVNLGNMSNLYYATPGTTIPLTGLAVRDLIDVYGANWHSRADLVWGAVASTGRTSGTPDGYAPSTTLWATRPDGQAPWNRGTIFAQSPASANIEPLYSGSPGSLTGLSSTTNSAVAATVDATQLGSWTKQDLKTGGTSFGYFNPTVCNVATVPLGGQVISQLYELAPTNTAGVAGKLLGNLILTRTGLSFQVAGGGATRIIGVSGNLAFGTVTTGTTATATMTITNSGSDALTVTGITYPTGFSGAFSGTIGAGNSTNVTVTFTPVAVQSYSGTVTVNSDATSGTGTIAASGNGTVLATRIIALSGSLSFGNVTVGSTGTATLTIANNGNSTLNVTGITYPIGFSGAFSGTIAAGNSTNVVVTFAPVAAQSYSGTVSVSSDKTSGANTISASGTGTPVPTRIIGLSGNLAFGSVTTGATATATLTIANSGNSALTVTGITYPTGFSGAFSGTITAGNSTNVTVTFAPVAVQSYSGTVTVASDATSGTSTISASGSGTAIPNRAPEFVVAPMVHNAVLSNGTLFVAVADSAAVFMATATDPDGDAVNILWNFGDGVATNGTLVSHLYTNCGPYQVTAVATDGTLSNSAPLTVSVPCEFATNIPLKVQIKVNFTTTKVNADSMKLQGMVDLGAAFVPAGKKVLVDVGGAFLPFTLSDKGKGVDTNTTSSCQFTAKKGTDLWTYKAQFKKGDWSTAWANYGLTNGLVAKPGLPVNVPVIVVVGDESFMSEPTLTYTATPDKTGSAKPVKE